MQYLGLFFDGHFSTSPKIEKQFGIKRMHPPSPTLILPETALALDDAENPGSLTDVRTSTM